MRLRLKVLTLNRMPGAQASTCESTCNFVLVFLKLEMRKTVTFQDGADLGNCRHPTCAQVLSYGHFKQEDRDAAKKHRDEVDDKEDAATIFVAQVGESPNI